MQVKKTHKTLYVHVADKLRKQIAKLAAGALLPAESRLAKQFGVSVATVREAIRLLAAEGRVESQQGRGTLVLEVAPQSVALVMGLDILDEQCSRFYPETMRATRQALEAAGERVRLYYGRATAEMPDASLQCDALYEDLEGGKLSGVITCGVFPEERLAKATRQQALPLVGMYAGYPHAVRHDVERFLKDGVEYCVQQGRRKIAMLAWNGAMDPDFCNFGQFTQALEAHGIAAQKAWHRADLHPNLPGAGWEGFRELWSAGREKPDALIITDDSLFPDAWQAICELQIDVPGELLIVSQAREGAMLGGNPSLPIARLEVSPRNVGLELISVLKESMAGAQEVRRLLTAKFIPMPGKVEGAEALKSRFV